MSRRCWEIAPDRELAYLAAAEQRAKQLFGYDEIREWQLEACCAVLKGHDCVVSAPTGGGKGLTFVLPLLAHWAPNVDVEEDYVAPIVTVVAPLIELMQEQVLVLLSIIGFCVLIKI